MVYFNTSISKTDFILSISLFKLIIRKPFGSYIARVSNNSGFIVQSSIEERYEVIVMNINISAYNMYQQLLYLNPEQYQERSDNINLS